MNDEYDVKINPANNSIFNSDITMNNGYTFHYPKVLWVVTIPKGNEFTISYTKELSVWQRFWMKFIGWGVKKGE